MDKVCGFDVHKDSVFACILDEQGKKKNEKRYMTLSNLFFIKQLPGRKSDVKDAQWIAECLQKNLIKSSFVVDGVLRQMRQYIRQHRRLTKNRVRLEQHLDNQLQRCNIRFSNYVSNQGGNVSMRKVIKPVSDTTTERKDTDESKRDFVKYLRKD